MLQSEASHKLCHLPDPWAHPWPGTLPPPFITKLWHFSCNILTTRGADSLSPRDITESAEDVYCLFGDLPLSFTLFFLPGCRKRLSHLSALKTLVRSSIMMASQSPLQLSSDPTCCRSVSGQGGQDKCGLAAGRVMALNNPHGLNMASVVTHMETCMLYTNRDIHIASWCRRVYNYEICWFICILCFNYLYGNETCNYLK